MPIVDKFWGWYERHYTVNVGLAGGLFLFQLVHLYWLTTNVVSLRLFEVSYFRLTPFWETIIVLVDYTEIPAIFAISLLYIHELKKQFSWKSIGYLVFINSQWLHLFWITDEFILEQFTGQSLIVFPIWLLWGAILIDYLELPVIYDTLRRFGQRITG
ncbi:MAG: hypothetical protein U1C57_02415 [Candidatus Doudnabacteria bacterium]|nr:hypothetical protein [bacterium]MDZ4243935.1 hypothetical protein [Candidatus Doudnabacteria bacterium]